MRGKAVFLIGTSDRPPAAGIGLAEQVFRHWCAPVTPTVSTHVLSHILEAPAMLEGCGLAWILTDEPRPEGLYDLVALLQDRNLPIVLTRPGDLAPVGSPVMQGVIGAPPQTDPACVAAVLRALWTQAESVRALQTELALLQLHHGGVIDQFDKIDEELRLAAQLQRDFLPNHLPSIPGIELDVLFRPTGYVSGDIYDVRRLDEDHVGFFLADAVGHGVPAALLTVYIKSSLMSRQIDAAGQGHRIVPPHQMLALLNHDILRNQVEQVRTVTAVYGVLNVRDRTVQLARAGHPFPMLLRRNGTVESLGPDGAMLGVFPDEVYEPLQLQLEPGDRLLFFSDGFETAFPEPSGTPTNKVKAPPHRRRQLANNHYLDEFRDLAHGSVPEAIQRLAEKLDLQAGSLNQNDDLTMLLVGVSAESERYSPSAVSLATV